MFVWISQQSNLCGLQWLLYVSIYIYISLSLSLSLSAVSRTMRNLQVDIFIATKWELTGASKSLIGYQISGYVLTLSLLCGLDLADPFLKMVFAGNVISKNHTCMRQVTVCGHIHTHASRHT